MWSNVATDTNYTLSINNQQTSSNKGLICNDNDESIENNLLCKCHDITRQHSYLFMIVIIIEIKSNSNNNGDQHKWHLTACLHWQFQLNIWKNVKDEWLLDSRCEVGRWWYMSSDEPGLHSYADMQHQDKTQKLYNEETN